VEPCVEIFYPLQQLVLGLGKFVPHPDSHLERLGEVPGICNLQSGPSFHPVIISSSDKQLTRLLVGAYIYCDVYGLRH
jgi:hypothetical protein